MQKIDNSQNVIYGTAKLGNQNYGFSSGRYNLFSREEFVNVLLENGIDRFDTSPRYGDAMSILGNVLKNKSKNIKIDSKIIGLKPCDKKNGDKILVQVENCLKKLNVESLNVLYLHQNEIEIISDSSVHEGLKYVLEKGLVQGIGTSVYSHEELDYSLLNDLFNTIQIPVNILNTSFYDRVLLTSENNHKELIARSIFLQGTLLNLDSIVLKSINLELHNAICKLNAICRKYDTTVFNEAKKTVLKLSDLKVIQSSLSFINLKSNLSFITHVNDALIEEEIKYLRDLKYTFTNPRNWKI